MKLLNIILVSVFITFVSADFIHSMPTNLTPVANGATVWTVLSFKNMAMQNIYQQLGTRVTIRKIGHDVLIEGLCNHCHADINKPCHFVCTQYMCDQNSTTILHYLINVMNADSFMFLHNHLAKFCINGANGSGINVQLGNPAFGNTYNSPFITVPSIGGIQHNQAAIAAAPGQGGIGHYQVTAVAAAPGQGGIRHYQVPAVAAVRGCGVNRCGVNGCGVNRCGVNGCGVNGCGVNGCGVNGCRVNGCGVNGCGVNGCGVNGCGVNGCGVNGCGVNGCHHHTSVVAAVGGCGLGGLVHHHIPVVAAVGGCGLGGLEHHHHIPVVAAVGHHNSIVAAGINNLLNHGVGANVVGNPYLGAGFHNHLGHHHGLHHQGVDTVTTTTMQQHSHSHLTLPLPTRETLMYVVKSFSDSTLNNYYWSLRRRIKLYIHDGRAKIIGGWNSCWTSSLNHPSFMCRRKLCNDHSSLLENTLVSDLTQTGFQFILVHNTHNTNPFKIIGPNGSYVILQSIKCNISHGCSRVIGY